MTDWKAAYEIVMASDLERDGMWLEAWSDVANLVLTAFYSDVDHTFQFDHLREDLPVAFVEWFQAEAERRLPVVADATDSADG